MQPPTSGTTQPSRPSRRYPSETVDREAEDKAEKRAKAAEDVEITRVSHGSELGAELVESPAIFEPSFTSPNGHAITVTSSLVDNPHLAMTLLNGVALPKDMELLQTGKADNIAKLCCHVAKVHHSIFVSCFSKKFFKR